VRIWAVTNQKGGVGKTTTAVSLAGQLALEGESVLLLDLDPHGSLTSYFGLDPDGLTQSLYTLFEQAANGAEPDATAAIHQTQYEGIALLPASTALATLDRQLGKQDGMGLVLVRALRRLADKYSYVLLDCPPLLGVLMVNALAASQRLLMPVQTEFLAMKGLERMLRTVAMVRRSRGRDIDYTIVPTMFDRRTRASVDSLRALRQRYPERIWSGVIPIDTQFRDASSRGIPLSHMRPSSRGARAYRQLLAHLTEHAVAAELVAS
jgi:chromosome partitioning protein